MKALIFLTIIFYPLTLNGQNDCYKKFVDQGLKFLAYEKLEDALSNFKAAKACNDRPENLTKLLEYINDTNEYYIRKIKERTRAAELNKIDYYRTKEEALIFERETDSIINMLLSSNCERLEGLQKFVLDMRSTNENKNYIDSNLQKQLIKNYLHLSETIEDNLNSIILDSLIIDFPKNFFPITDTTYFYISYSFNGAQIDKKLKVNSDDKLIIDETVYLIKNGHDFEDQPKQVSLFYWNSIKGLFIGKGDVVIYDRNEAYNNYMKIMSIGNFPFNSENDRKIIDYLEKN